MKRTHPFRRLMAPLLALALVISLAAPASAFFWNKKDSAPYVEDFSKNGLIGSIIAFEQKDFAVKTENKAVLNSITIDTLPDPRAGTLVIGGQPLEVGSVVDSTALGGLRFQSLSKSLYYPDYLQLHALPLLWTGRQAHRRHHPPAGRGEPAHRPEHGPVHL